MLIFKRPFGAENVRVVWALLIGALLTQQGLAQDVGLGVNVGYGQTDNIGRNAASERDSAFQTLGFDFDLTRDSRRLNGALGGGVDLLRYSEKGIIDDDREVLGSLDGRLAIGIVPERFNWDFAGNFGQMRTNPLAGISPTNREHVTIFSTGPRVDLPLGGRSTLRLSGEVAERTYEVSDSLDSRTTSVQLSLFRAISPVSNLGISFDHSENDFVSLPDDQDYEFDNVYLTYSKDFASGGIQAAVGSGEVTIGTESSSSAVMSFGWDRALGARSHLSISAGRDFADAGELFRNGGVPGLGGAGSLGGIGGINDARWYDVVLTPNPLERTTLGAAFTVTGERTDMSVSFGVAEERYEVNADLDNDGAYINFSLSREFNPRWSGGVQLRGWRQNFGRLSQDDDNFYIQARVTRELGSRASIEFAYEYNTRDSETNPFDQNVYTINFSYQIVQ